MRAVLYAAALAATRSASAEPPVVSVVEPRPEPIELPPTPHDATETSGAPRPGEESGRIDAGEPGDSTARRIARGVFYVPKVVVLIAMLPIRGAFYLEDRLQLAALYDHMFFYRHHTIGVLPTATWETGFGGTIGARLFVLDAFGRGEHVIAQATTGGADRVGLLASIDSGDRFGRLRLEVAGNFDRRPNDPFYGIGNSGDLLATGSGIDALTDPAAVATHFRYQEARAAALADITVVPRLHVVARGAFVQLEYSQGETGPPIEDVYQPSSLVGFDENERHLYGELELGWDGRRRESPWDSQSLNSAGTLVRAFAGFSHRLDEHDDFWHYGGEVQHYLRLGYGPRVVIARFHGEAVTGNLDQIPITELPLLGGSAFLRGYPYARFRDRIALAGSLQYMWSVMAYASAFVFTDFGRVYRSWDDLTPAGLHVGYGAGIELYGRRSFLVDLTVASSSDGGIAVTAEFTPVLDARPRWR